jgi:hypothetical protein
VHDAVSNLVAVELAGNGLEELITIGRGQRSGGAGAASNWRSERQIGIGVARGCALD